MMRKRLVLFVAIISLCGITTVFAESSSPRLTVTPSDGILSVLQRHNGKVVTVKLIDGQELTGKVADVGGHLVHLEALTGREYYDAVVDVNKIEAILVRMKDGAARESQKP